MSKLLAHAFDLDTGVLSVDYAGYLSKHDIVYNSQNSIPSEGLPVGNGKVGAMVWNTSGGLTMQVTNVDGSPSTQLSSGLISLYTNPGLDIDYTDYEQRLNLHDGLVTVKYGSDRTVTIFGDTNSELLGIHVDDSRTGLSTVSLDLSIWDTSGLANSGWDKDIPDIESWKIVNTWVNSDLIAISRGEADPDHFGYTLAASVEGAAFKTQMVNSTTLRLHITPSPSYTIWIANPSRQNSADYDSPAASAALIANAKSSGYTKVLNNSKAWWHDFWAKSFVQYSNSAGDADYLENDYYVSKYLLAGASRGKFPYQFMHGVWRWRGDEGRWGWGYWNFNMRAVYDSFLASNHIDLMTSYLNLYSNTLSRIKADTLTYYGIDGAKVPETMKWNGIGNNLGGDYTEKVFTAGPDIAYKMYMKYKYTNDLAYLRNTAYPFMKEIVKFYQSSLSFNGTHYEMVSSNARENYWNVKNALPDLAAVKALFPMAIEASTLLNMDPTLRTEWQNILIHIAPYPIAPYAGGMKYLPCENTGEVSHNDENPELEIVYYGLTGIGYPDIQTAINTWISREKGPTIWSQEAVNAARLGLGLEAFNYMRTMQARNQLHTNGLADDGNGLFESNGLLMSAINESLMQSYNGIIRVFPAVPPDTAFVAKFTLLAKGGFLVSSERESSEIKYVGLKSVYGNEASIFNPWGSEQIQVRRTSDNEIITTSSDNLLRFHTAANEVYVIERTSKPLSYYTFQGLTGTANKNMKSFTYNGMIRYLGKSGLTAAH